MTGDDMRDLLRRAAEDHRPDRARMLARVERGMTRPGVRPSRPHGGARTRWPRVALAAAAVAAVVTAATVIASPGTPPGPSPVAPASTVSAAPTIATGPATPAARTEDGPLRADGALDPHSIPSWSQSNLTLDTREPLTALTVEMRIALGPGLADTGHWQTAPTEDFTVTVAQESGFLVYRWTLGPGRTLPVARHVFAAQYNHADGGRDTGADGYRVDAGARATVWGGFAPAAR
ncbi:hypothetical protein ACWEQL_12010 [Kitasatospora sp. NPDC004240]